MQQVTSILDFADGAIVNRVNHELKKIMENIVDPNTDDKARELRLKILITPKNDRRTVGIRMTVDKKLRPTSEVETQMVFQSLDGEMKSYELTGIPDGQQDLFGNVHTQKFIKLNSKKEDNK